MRKYPLTSRCESPISDRISSELGVCSNLWTSWFCQSDCLLRWVKDRNNSLYKDERLGIACFFSSDILASTSITQCILCASSLVMLRREIQHMRRITYCYAIAFLFVSNIKIARDKSVTLRARDYNSYHIQNWSVMLIYWSECTQCIDPSKELAWSAISLSWIDESRVRGSSTAYMLDVSMLFSQHDDSDNLICCQVLK